MATLEELGFKEEHRQEGGGDHRELLMSERGLERIVAAVSSYGQPGTGDHAVMTMNAERQISGLTDEQRARVEHWVQCHNKAWDVTALKAKLALEKEASDADT